MKPAVICTSAADRGNKVYVCSNSDAFILISFSCYLANCTQIICNVIIFILLAKQCCLLPIQPQSCKESASSTGTSNCGKAQTTIKPLNLHALDAVFLTQAADQGNIAFKFFKIWQTFIWAILAITYLYLYDCLPKIMQNV